MLVTKSFIKESVPADHFSSPGELAGRILISNIIAGDVVVEKRLAPTTLQSGGIPAVLEPGSGHCRLDQSPQQGGCSGDHQ